MSEEQLPITNGYYTPSYIPEWNIYDCFYSDTGELVIICPGEIRPHPRMWLINSCGPDNGNDDKQLEFRVDICPANHTYIYKLPAQAMLGQPDQIKIKIISNGTQTKPGNSQIISIRPNRYPSLANQQKTVVMATMVKNEDKFIRTWIDFHLRLGVHKFIIYDNQESLETAEGNYIDNKHLDQLVFQARSPLLDLLADYIQSGKVILINWPYTKFLKVSGVSGQTTQQNHAIRAFDTADWIGLFDVDEYINIQRPDIVLGAAGGEGIRRFLDGIARKTQLGISRLGGLQFKNKFFYNPDNQPTENGQFLRIPNCANGIKHMGNEKIFVIPRNVRTFAIHMITSGSSVGLIPPKLAFFNHYCYLNKPSRGRDRTPWRDDSITRYLP